MTDLLNYQVLNTGLRIIHLIMFLPVVLIIYYNFKKEIK